MLVLFLLLLAIACISGIFIIKKQSQKRYTRYTLKRALEPYVFLLPVLLLLVVLFGYPLLNCVVLAFQNYKLTAPNDIYFNGLENFVKLFTDPDIGLVVRNSLIYLIACVLGQFIFGMSLALLLRKPFFGRGLYQSLVFLPWAFPPFVIGLIFRWSFNGEYGVVNDVLLKLGVIEEKIAWLGTPGLSLLVVIMGMIWMGVPFFAIMYLAALQSIPADVYEAASMDGCGVLRSFFAITLPYIKPTIIVTLLLRTIWIFNSFDLVVVITSGGPASSSQTLPSYMYTKAFSAYDFGLASALGILLIVILLIYSTVFLKTTKYNEAGDF